MHPAEKRPIPGQRVEAAHGVHGEKHVRGGGFLIGDQLEAGTREALLDQGVLHAHFDGAGHLAGRALQALCARGHVSGRLQALLDTQEAIPGAAISSMNPSNAELLETFRRSGALDIV